VTVEGERLVFIGGLHRSGTSIVHRCLSDHPDVSGFHDTGVWEDEGQHLQTVYPTAAVLGGPGTFGFDPRAYMDETSPLVSPVNASRILSEWAAHWDTSRRLLVEKSPPNVVRTRFLQALFPGCRFIIVLRHPVAVGYATQKWTTRMPALRRLGLADRRMPKVWIGRLIEHWLRCHEQFERDRPRLDAVHVLRYEDFVARPEEHLGELHAFLGLKPAPLVREVRGGANDAYVERWLGRCGSPLTRPYARRVTRSFEERVNRFGYSLVDRSTA
jgi:hypothetical protein